MCVCDWTLIIFQDNLALLYLMSTFFFFKKKKNFWCTSTQITLKFFFHVSHVELLNFFLLSHMLKFNFNFNSNRHA